MVGKWWLEWYWRPPGHLTQIEAVVLPQNLSIYGRAEMEDIPISNCNAEEGDGDGTSEGSKILLSDATSTSKTTIGVSHINASIGCCCCSQTYQTEEKRQQWPLLTSTCRKAEISQIQCDCNPKANS
jgi:hypothetical protein